MSTWFALQYLLKPGTEAAVAELFQKSKVPEYAIRDDEGKTVGQLLRTLVFQREGLCIRVIEVEGEVQTLARHIGRQPAIREFEEAVEPLLSEPRDVRSPEGAQSFFRTSGLLCILNRQNDG